jgi:hypothetical protein
MNDQNIDRFLERIQDDMRTAIKSRQKIELDQLRVLRARISNSEAVPIEEGVPGVEAKRKSLTIEDVKRIISDEENEIQSALTAIDSQNPYALELGRRLEIVRRYK